MFDYQSHNFKVGDKFKRTFKKGNSFNGVVQIRGFVDGSVILKIPRHKKLEVESLSWFIANDKNLEFIGNTPIKECPQCGCTGLNLLDQPCSMGCQ